MLVSKAYQLWYLLAFVLIRVFDEFHHEIKVLPVHILQFIYEYDLKISELLQKSTTLKNALKISVCVAFCFYIVLEAKRMVTVAFCLLQAAFLGSLSALFF